MRINHVHQFTGAEENLIMEGLLALADSFKDEDGNLRPDLTTAQRKKYDSIMEVYRSS